MIPQITPATSEIARNIRSRRTINSFQETPPPLSTVLQAIELARWAPNHKLTEPWRFHILGPETAHAVVTLNTRLVEEEPAPGGLFQIADPLADESRAIARTPRPEEQGSEAAKVKYKKWSAIPGWLAVSYLRSDDPVRDLENYAAVCCAIQNLSLFLWSENIGVKWSTGPVTRHEKLYEILHVDPHVQRIVGLFWYGYPARTPEMKRKDMAEIAAILP